MGKQLVVSTDKTQAYGLSSNDSLVMMGGVGTLSGGKGSDTFELMYSADKPLTELLR